MIAVVNSGGANLASVLFALERLGKEYTYTSDPEVVRKASHVLLPGVGAAANAMKTLQSAPGLIECLRATKQPIMGICLGMQLLFEHSAEGDVDMLGLIPGRVEKFESDNMTVPHMGWNTIEKIQNIPLLNGLEDDAYFYFVHSFKADISSNTAAQTSYGTLFTSIVARDNVMGCQFHPERSGDIGARLLDNFTRL